MILIIITLIQLLAPRKRPNCKTTAAIVDSLDREPNKNAKNLTYLFIPMEFSSDSSTVTTNKKSTDYCEKVLIG